MKKKWTVLTIYLGLLVILGVIIYAVPSLLGLLDRTYITEYGEVQVTDEVSDAWIVRDDTVYCAKENSDVAALVKEKQLVKGKSHILSMKSGGNNTLGPKYMNLKQKLGDSMRDTSGYCKGSGYVTFTADGEEGTLTPSALDKLTESDLKSIGNDNIDLTVSSCSEGQPLFRVTKNGRWWLVFFTDKESAKKYTVGSAIRTTLNEKTVDTTVRSVDSVKGEDQVRVVLTCKEYHPSYLTERKVSLSNEIESDKGLLVKEESIIKVNGQKGVLVKNKVGRNYFVPIKIKASDGETAAVYEDLYMNSKGEFVETLGNYDEIVQSPSKSDIKEAKK